MPGPRSPPQLNHPLVGVVTTRRSGAATPSARALDVEAASACGRIAAVDRDAVVGAAGKLSDATTVCVYEACAPTRMSPCTHTRSARAPGRSSAAPVPSRDARAGFSSE